MDDKPEPAAIPAGEADLEPRKVGDALTVLWNELVEWIRAAIELLPNLVVALLVFLLFLFLSRLLMRGTERALARVAHHPEVTNLLKVLVRAVTLGAGIFLGLHILGLTGIVTTLLAGVGVVGLALGFAFQDIASNFVSGVLLALRRPFRIHDLVKTGEYFGVVESLDLRNTGIRTPTGELVIIPNKDVYGSPLVNYTESPLRRVDIAVGVSYADDLRRARAVVQAALEGIDEAHRAPDQPVDVLFDEFGDSSINFQARFWTKPATQRAYLTARSEAIIAIKAALDEAGIAIPFPIRTLDFGADIVGGVRLDRVLAPPGAANRPPPPGEVDEAG